MVGIGELVGLGPSNGALGAQEAAQQLSGHGWHVATLLAERRNRTRGNEGNRQPAFTAIALAEGLTKRDGAGRKDEWW